MDFGKEGKKEEKDLIDPYANAIEKKEVQSTRRVTKTGTQFRLIAR